MSQHDLDIANQGFPATRADINNALKALGSSNSGATAPSTTYANQLWYDTANNIIKIRNEDNDAWISVATVDQTNDLISITHTGMLDLVDDDGSASIRFQAPSTVTSTTTFTLPDGDGDSGQTLMTNGSGTLSWHAPYGNRNLIINGAMQVAQRGTSTTGVTTATYLVDRFRGRTTAGSIDLSQSTTAPAGFTNSFKLAVNTTNAFGTASDEAYFEQAVEAQNLQHLEYGLSTAQKITLSFWVRSSVAGTYGIWFYQDDATKDYSVSYTIDSTDTWEKKSVTIDGNTADAIDNNNESGMSVRWYLDGGSDRRGAVTNSWTTNTSTSTKLPTGAPAWMNGSNDWYITGVQLEIGEQATPFEHRSFGDELARCQRYFQKSYNYGTDPGSATEVGAMYNRLNESASNRAVNIKFPVEMRGNTTVVVYSLNGTAGAVSNCNTGFSHSSNVTGSSFTGTDGAGGLSKLVLGSPVDDIVGLHYTVEAEI